MLNTKQHLQNT